MSFAENFHNYCILSRFLSLSHYVTSTCAIASRLTHIHTLHFTHLNYSAWGIQYSKLRHIHTNTYTHVQDCEQNTAAVLTLTMCGIVRCISLVLESHTLQCLPNFTSHTPFLCTPSHLQPACIYKPAPCSHTHHIDILRGAADRYSHHLQVKVSERNSLWFFPFFAASMFCEAVVMVMGHKDSSGSQCTHEWEEHWVCLCECVCFGLCVLHNAWDNALKGLADDLPLISWMRCVIALEQKADKKAFVLFALVRVLINS